MRKGIKAITNKVTGIGGNPRLVGTLQILASTVCFGAIGTLAKFAYASGLRPELLLALRFSVAAAALWAYFLVVDRNSIRAGRRELVACAALGLAGYCVFSSLMFRAFRTVPASVAGMLFFSYTLFATLLEWAATRRRPQLRLWVGAGMISGGVFLALYTLGSGAPAFGVALAVAGAAWYAGYVVVSQKLLGSLDARTVTLHVTTAAALGFWVVGAPAVREVANVNARGWMIVLALALVSTVGALLLFFSGLEKVGSAEASQISILELIVTIGLAASVLGERLSPPLVLGAILMLIGMLAGQIRLTSRPRFGFRMARLKAALRGA